MPFDDLWAPQEQISQLLYVKITSEKRELEKRLAVLNRGMNLIEGNDKDAPQSYNANGEARLKYPRSIANFPNPQKWETWSARAKKPRWLVAAIKTGRKTADFEIGARE